MLGGVKLKKLPSAPSSPVSAGALGSVRLRKAPASSSTPGSQSSPPKEGSSSQGSKSMAVARGASHAGEVRAQEDSTTSRAPQSSRSSDAVRNTARRRVGALDATGVGDTLAQAVAALLRSKRHCEAPSLAAAFLIGQIETLMIPSSSSPSPSSSSPPGTEDTAASEEKGGPPDGKVKVPPPGDDLEPSHGGRGAPGNVRGWSQEQVCAWVHRLDLRLPSPRRASTASR